MSRKWRNWYQDEVDEAIKAADSRDKVKRSKNVTTLLYRHADFDGSQTLPAAGGG